MSEGVTFTGRIIDYFHPSAKMFDPRDIAKGLACTGRFNRQFPVFYSVAEHSVRVAEALTSQGPIVQLCGLIHDVSEAYLPDFTRAVKPHAAFIVDGALVPVEELEREYLAAAADWLKIPWPFPEAVWKVDDRMGDMEAEAMAGRGPLLDQLKHGSLGLDWKTAERIWIDAFHRLHRQAHHAAFGKTLPAIETSKPINATT